MTGGTLTSLLQHRAYSHGERRAYTFLADGEREHASLSYAGLDARARSIAACLRDRVSRGERIVLAYPPGLEFVTALFGCAYAGAIAVPVPLPRPRRGSERLDGVVKSCEPRLVMSTAAGLTALAATGLPEIEALDSESLADAGLEAAPVDVQPDDLALLQYTSGSTSAPRGVKVSHGNLMANLAMIAEAEANDATSRGVSWLPAYHDMGLVEGVLEPLYGGYPTWLMPPSAFLQRPVRWLQALSDFGGTVSGAPDFAYDLCVRRVSDDEIEALDLAAWRVAYSGAEPVRVDTLGAFAARFERCGFERRAFRPVYGLAEATALVTASVRGRDEPRASHVDDREMPLVSCGIAAAGTRVDIVDPASGQAVADGAIGEICVSGPSVAHGYWGVPEEDSRVFSRTGDGTIRLRTGDLGFLRDGELHIAGRIKDMIVLRGRKLYPQDVEHTAQAAHDLVCPGGVAAFGVHAGGVEALVVVAEVEDSPRVLLAPVLDAIAQSVLRDHECAIAATILVRRGALPRTSSGKLMRFRCRNDYLAGTLRALARSDAMHDSERRVA